MTGFLQKRSSRKVAHWNLMILPYFKCDLIFLTTALFIVDMY